MTVVEGEWDVRMLHPVSLNVNYIKGPSVRINGILPSFNRANIQLSDRVTAPVNHTGVKKQYMDWGALLKTATSSEVPSFSTRG